MNYEVEVKTKITFKNQLKILQRISLYLYLISLLVFCIIK